MEKAKTEPFYPDKDIRLSSMKIRAGYAFWTENEHELHEQRNRLKEANELLSEENDLIAVENKLKEQKAHIEAQNQVYERITAAIYPKQKRVEEILNNVEPEAESFAAALGKVCVFNAYSKRKSNLLLLSEDNLPPNNRRAVSSNAAGSMRQQSVKSIPRFRLRRLTSFTILSRPLQRHIWNRLQE